MKFTRQDKGQFHESEIGNNFLRIILTLAHQAKSDKIVEKNLNKK